MNIEAIIYKIKQTGRSTLKERKTLRNELINLIQYSPDFIEEQEYALFIKFYGTPIGGLFEKDQYTKVRPFGNFKDVFDEDPSFAQNLAEKLTGIYQDKTETIKELVSPKIKKLAAFQKQSQKQNGYGFEFGLLKGLSLVLSNKSIVYSIEEDNAYHNLANNFDTLSPEQQDEFIKAGTIAAERLLEIEDLSGEEMVIIKAQNDREGIKGDVRDLVIVTPNREIGFSCKNNNEAAKHPRISPHLDFVKDWLKINSGASQNYKQIQETIFNKLQPLRKKLWADVDPNNSLKEKEYYQPLLNNFKTELDLQFKINPQSIVNFFKYILGEQDLYKVVKKDSKKSVEIHGYSMDGSLNKLVSPIVLPTEIKKSFLKPNRSGINNTLIVEFNNDWAISLRIHNARETVENSFKFDICIESSPILFKECLDF